MYHLTDLMKRKIGLQILQAPHTFFFLDYDGTLAPIMPRPSQANLRESTREILSKLAANPKFSVGVITGRKLSEIECMVLLNNIIYAGNHGLELKGPGFCYTHAKTKEFRRTLKEVASAVHGMGKVFPGSFVEDKEITLCFHFRLVDDKWTAALRAEFVKRVTPWLNTEKIIVTESMKALEVRPYLDWDKGRAVQWILMHEDPESLPVYIGDDRTDEDAFTALAERGITIKVGYDKNSAAKYFLEDVSEVERFLSFMTIMGAGREPPAEAEPAKLEASK